MNGSTFQGGAFGIRIASVNKVNERYIFGKAYNVTHNVTFSW